MSKILRKFWIFLVIAAIAYISRTFKDIGHRMSNVLVSDDLEISNYTTAILKKGNGILFVETTDRMDPPSLVLCAIESAARVYPDRPVAFFMNGLKEIITEEDEKRAKQLFPTLSSFSNVYLFPLRMDRLFHNTPIKSWYDKVNPKKEKYWTHVKSDACRFALVWRFGGIYMDTDVISCRPIPNTHFVVAEDSQHTSAGIFGLSPNYPLAWQLMENFVNNYKGKIWGHQGPGVFQRVMKTLCDMPVFKTTDDVMCTNISYLHPERFYPIKHHSWKRYFEVWQYFQTFHKSYGLHLWNSMNKEGKSMVPGSKTLVERLYQKYCPTTYLYYLKKGKIQL